MSVLANISVPTSSVPTDGRPDCDRESATADYARRFAGEVGHYFIEQQTNLLLDCLIQEPLGMVLDIGGGHAQVASALAGVGHQVTILGSSKEALGQAESLVQSGKCIFQEGNFYALPYPDNSFDVVCSFRIISHVDQPERLIAEMCRVARHKVIIDYPPLCSFNVFYPLAFKIKKLIEKNTRTFSIFRSSEISSYFNKYGFRLEQHLPQFFLPMGLHRGLKQVTLARRLENFFKYSFLTQAFGSPVIASFISG